MVLSIMTTFLSEYSQIFPYMSPPPQEKNPTSATEIAPTVV